MYQPQNTQGNQQPPQQQQPQTQPYVSPQPGYGPPPAQYQPGQPYPQQPPTHPEVKPLPSNWQQPVQPGQWNPNGVYGGVPEPKRGIPWWGTAIILVLAIGVIATIGTVLRSGSTPTSTSSNQVQIVATAAVEPTNTVFSRPANQGANPTPVPTIRSIPTPTAVPQVVKGRIGETLTQNGYIVTVNSAEKSESYGDFRKAKDGFIFLAVDITIQSDKAKDVSSSVVQASLKDGQGFTYDSTWVGKDPQLASKNDIPKGEKVRGWVTFEVPKSAKGFTLEYEGFLEFSNPTRIDFVLE
jgi:hypothetical protein